MVRENERLVGLRGDYWAELVKMKLFGREQLTLLQTFVIASAKSRTDGRKRAK